MVRWKERDGGEEGRGRRRGGRDKAAREETPEGSTIPPGSSKESDPKNPQVVFFLPTQRGTLGLVEEGGGFLNRRIVSDTSLTKLSEGGLGRSDRSSILVSNLVFWGVLLSSPKIPPGGEKIDFPFGIFTNSLAGL